MQSKTIIITGASDGIGASAARKLHRLSCDHRLILIGRDPIKTARVAKECGAIHFSADFESLGEVRRLAHEILNHLDGAPIDALANNAGGIFDGPFLTADGFERTWQVNVVAPFLLTALLRDWLTQATIIQTASLANLLMSRFDPSDPTTLHKFSAERAYGNAKLGDILMTRYFHEQGLTSVAFHPGILATNFGHSSNAVLGKTYSSPLAKAFGAPDQGGDNLVFYLLGSPGVHFISGEYYNHKRRLGLQHPIAKNVNVARRVFKELSQKLNLEW